MGYALATGAYYLNFSSHSATRGVLIYKPCLITKNLVRAVPLSGEITGKSLVPEHLCRDDFTAELWIKPIQEALAAKVSS